MRANLEVASNRRVDKVKYGYSSIDQAQSVVNLNAILFFPLNYSSEGLSLLSTNLQTQNCLPLPTGIVYFDLFTHYTFIANRSASN